MTMRMISIMYQIPNPPANMFVFGCQVRSGQVQGKQQKKKNEMVSAGQAQVEMHNETAYLIPMRFFPTLHYSSLTLSLSLPSPSPLPFRSRTNDTHCTVPVISLRRPVTMCPR